MAIRGTSGSKPNRPSAARTRSWSPTLAPPSVTSMSQWRAWLGGRGDRVRVGRGRPAGSPPRRRRPAPGRRARRSWSSRSPPGGTGSPGSTISSPVASSAIARTSPDGEPRMAGTGREPHGARAETPAGCQHDVARERKSPPRETDVAPEHGRLVRRGRCGIIERCRVLLDQHRVGAPRHDAAGEDADCLAGADPRGRRVARGRRAHHAQHGAPGAASLRAHGPAIHGRDVVRGLVHARGHGRGEDATRRPRPASHDLGAGRVPGSASTLARASATLSTGGAERRAAGVLDLAGIAYSILPRSPRSGSPRG